MEVFADRRVGNFVAALLAVTVATWFGTEDAAVVSREQWHHSGYLVSSDVKSDPVSFSVSPNPQFHDCGYND